MTSIVLDIRDVHARYGKHEVLRGVTLQVRTYADKAALLLDGRMVREWSDSEIAVMREQGAARFEEALAQSG